MTLTVAEALSPNTPKPNLNVKVWGVRPPGRGLVGGEVDLARGSGLG